MNLMDFLSSAVADAATGGGAMPDARAVDRGRGGECGARAPDPAGKAQQYSGCQPWPR